MSLISKVALGTVQFGLKYGINNQTGQVNETEVAAILKLAAENDIDTLDTAYGYGNSETVLGQAGVAAFKVISKLPPCEPDEVKGLFEESLKRLQTEHVYGYLLHSYTSFQTAPGIWQEVNKLKDKRKISKVGFSLYSPAELLALWEQGISPDLVQVPYNLFDRRFEPYFPQLKENGTEIHIRSAFLQGLFFKDLSNIPVHFQSVKHKLDALHQFAEKYKISKAHLCLLFTLNNPLVDKVVIGIDNKQQLKENLQLSKLDNEEEAWQQLITTLQVDNESIINPAKWPAFNA